MSYYYFSFVSATWLNIESYVIYNSQYLIMKYTFHFKKS